MLLSVVMAVVTVDGPDSHVPSGSVCNSPFITAIVASATDSLVVTWQDLFFEAGKTYDLEVVHHLAPPTGIPTIDSIDTTQYTLGDLASGSAYDIYIRGVCTDGVSTWNGPVRGITHIDNENACGLNLPINDNNCPDLQEFVISVAMDTTFKLGTNLFIHSFDLIIDHPWLADLNITLVSPAGQSITLSSDNGVGIQNMGNPQDSTCAEIASFAAFACTDIDNVNGPYTGVFRPEDPLELLYDSSTAAGEWLLRICDKASDDLGQLAYASLQFTQNTCDLPPSILIVQEGDTSVTLNVANISACDSIEVAFGTGGLLNPENAEFTTIFDCNDSLFTLTGLQIATQYVVFSRRLCGDQLSQWSCPLFVTTACGAITLHSGFDDEAICEPVCSGTCPLTDTIWQNIAEDNRDWIAMDGPTSTEFTGPNGSRTGNGLYLYTEASGEECNIGAEAILQSVCLELMSGASACDLSFWYHLFGANSGSLRLDASTDGGTTWTEYWSVAGDQGDMWQQANVDFTGLEGQIFVLRFASVRGIGFLGDAAIDDIQLHGATLVSKDRQRYYLDSDEDGFGAPDSSICVCTLISPEGFRPDSTDCDDLNSAINPGVPESPCNLIDDNCNEQIDEGGNPSPIDYDVILIENATCTGIDDGVLHVAAIQGTAPFAYLWNTGQDTNVIQNLSPGVYQCTITDANGCNGVTQFFQIIENAVLNYFLTAIIEPECPGAGNGVIEGVVAGGQEPMSFAWSNGDTTLQLSGIDIGDYQLTVTDANGCWLISDTIHVDSDAPFNVALIARDDASCYGSADGEIQIIAPGAIQPVSFLWSNNDTTSRADSLVFGFYSCTITDGDGCQNFIQNIPIGQPEDLIVRVDALEPPTCHEGNDGTIQITATGGTPPYFYNWNTNAFTDDIFDVSAGNYTVSVSDLHGCTRIIDTLFLDAPPAIDVGVAQLSNALCPADKSGAIELSIDGGMPPYVFDWSTGSSDSSHIEGLIPGAYAVTVSDAFGCKGILRDILIISVNEPLELQVITKTDIQCHGDSSATLAIEVTNGQGPYRFNWSIGKEHESMSGVDSIVGLPAGEYRVTITDQRGCIGTSNTVAFTQPTRLRFQLDSIKSNNCFGGEEGAIYVSNDGGVPPYMYTWSNGADAPVIQGLASGIYTLTITDQMLCPLVTPSFQIQETADSVYITFETEDASSEENGWAEVSVQGALPPLSYQWDSAANNQVTARAGDLPAGFYSVSVTDAMLCLYVDSVEVRMSTATQNPSVENIRLFPNPNNGMFYLNSEVTVEKVSLVDVVGRKVHVETTKIAAQQWQCNGSSCMPGLYFLEINGRATGVKVIIGQP